MQSDPHLVFDHWKCVQFNYLLLRPHLNSNIARNLHANFGEENVKSAFSPFWTVTVGM